MHISALEEYGLRCALQLAKSRETETISASEIAEREGISMQYAAKILHLFRKAGLVVTVRGVQGGFRLSKVPADISLQQVLLAVHTPKRNSQFCQQYKGRQSACVHLDNCSSRPVWQIIAGYFSSVMERVTLADLLVSEGESRKRMEFMAKTTAENLETRLKNSVVQR